MANRYDNTGQHHGTPSRPDDNPVDKEWYESLTPERKWIADKFGLKNAEEMGGMNSSFLDALADLYKVSKMEGYEDVPLEGLYNDFSSFTPDLFKVIKGKGYNGNTFSSLTPEQLKNVYDGFMTEYNSYRSKNPYGTYSGNDFGGVEQPADEEAGKAAEEERARREEENGAERQEAQQQSSYSKEIKQAKRQNQAKERPVTIKPFIPIEQEKKPETMDVQPVKGLGYTNVPDARQGTAPTASNTIQKPVVDVPKTSLDVQPVSGLGYQNVQNPTQPSIPSVSNAIAEPTVNVGNAAPTTQSVQSTPTISAQKPTAGGQEASQHSSGQSEPSAPYADVRNKTVSSQESVQQPVQQQTAAPQATAVQEQKTQVVKPQAVKPQANTSKGSVDMSPVQGLKYTTVENPKVANPIRPVGITAPTMPVMPQPSVQQPVQRERSNSVVQQQQQPRQTPGASEEIYSGNEKSNPMKPKAGVEPDVLPNTPKPDRIQAWEPDQPKIDPLGANPNPTGAGKLEFNRSEENPNKLQEMVHAVTTNNVTKQNKQNMDEGMKGGVLPVTETPQQRNERLFRQNHGGVTTRGLINGNGVSEYNGVPQSPATIDVNTLTDRLLAQQEAERARFERRRMADRISRMGFALGNLVGAGGGKTDASAITLDDGTKQVGEYRKDMDDINKQNEAAYKRALELIYRKEDQDYDERKLEASIEDARAKLAANIEAKRAQLEETAQNHRAMEDIRRTQAENTAKNNEAKTGIMQQNANTSAKNADTAAKNANTKASAEARQAGGTTVITKKTNHKGQTETTERTTKPNGSSQTGSTGTAQTPAQKWAHREVK